MLTVIFSGYNDRGVIAFCRFAKANNIPFTIIAKVSNDKILHTLYAKYVSIKRKNISISIEDIINYCKFIKAKYEIKNLFILPSTEYINRILIFHQELLRKNHIYTGLTNKDTYIKISDKYSFSNICLENDIQTPSISSSIPDTTPFVIKPKTYVSSQGVIEKPTIIHHLSDAHAFLKDKNIDDFYFQEFITGQNFYLLYYFSKNSKTLAFSQENLLQQFNGGSMILSVSSNLHLQPISNKFVKLFEKLDFQGLVMVELIFMNDTYYMIEANPRIWGPSQLILDANMSLFDAFATDNKLMPRTKYKKKYKEKEWYFWSGGLFDNLSENRPIIYHYFQEKDFTKLYPYLMNNEIYLRNDTINLFFTENQINNAT